MTATTTTGQFTYEAGFTYATDPATIAAVKVGDVIRVESHIYDEPITYTAVVEAVQSDQYGIYLATHYNDTKAELRWEKQVSTITDRITLVDAGQPTIGAKVTYHGSQTRGHGEARIIGLCLCGTGDASPDGHYLLATTGHYGLGHVNRASFTIA